MWPARNEDGIQIIGGVGVALAKPRVAIAKSKGPTCMLVASWTVEQGFQIGIERSRLDGAICASSKVQT